MRSLARDGGRGRWRLSTASSGGTPALARNEGNGKRRRSEAKQNETGTKPDASFGRRFAARAQARRSRRFRDSEPFQSLDRTFVSPKQKGRRPPIARTRPRKGAEWASCGSREPKDMLSHILIFRKTFVFAALRQASGRAQARGRPAELILALAPCGSGAFRPRGRPIPPTLHALRRVARSDQTRTLYILKIQEIS